MTTVLRSWRVDDADALRAAVAESPDLEAQLPDLPLHDRDGCATAIRTVLAGQDAPYLNLAIVDDGLAVGNVGISSIDRRHETAWISYWMTCRLRGRGTTAKAVASAAEWVYLELDLFRLELGHRVNNPASCAVAIRAGFVVEGLERAKLRYGSQRYDVETHARLRTDRAPETPLLQLEDIVLPREQG
ncbi:GNAT family N-acetyltransferase [Georgenia deserti]|uniref:GNAT family N-acetyltransferase n=1 Tax=Georgenia deserti TaxID=2093781 RepID=A0ABW4L163_9MICO